MRVEMDLWRKLESAARARGVPVNREIRDRLEASLVAGDLQAELNAVNKKFRDTVTEMAEENIRLREKLEITELRKRLADFEEKHKTTLSLTSFEDKHR